MGDVYTQLEKEDVFGVFLQYPADNGNVSDISPLVEIAKSKKAFVCVASDLMALVMLKSPGALGADIVVGSAQRFGVPMGYGGPHAAFFAVKDKFKRSIPGRVIGVSIDTHGNQALRMAMQTREQHIRREKATSNICTAQALLANMAGFYAVFHGPDGLKTIAQRIHRMANIFAKGIQSSAYSLQNSQWFDTLTVDVGDQQQVIVDAALAKGMNVRTVGNNAIGISFDEAKTIASLESILAVFGVEESIEILEASLDDNAVGISSNLLRDDAILSHPTFNSYQSETEMLRYIKRLENKDLSLTHAMIPLGSCTMKLNATSQLMPVSWEGFSNIHPFAPANQTQGYQAMIDELCAWLEEITGYDLSLIHI